jgi:bacterioferritin-associated ferredoxin
MIVCSCNVLTDHEIRNVVTTSREQPLSAPQVYDCLGCSIRCGRCARAVKRIITEASIGCAERAPEAMSDSGYSASATELAPFLRVASDPSGD